MKAFWLAGLLFLVTLLAFHLFGIGHVRTDPAAFGLWIREEKALSMEGLRDNLEPSTILVFGSSEFQHGTQTLYHPSRLFAQTDARIMLIGAGYYQSLGHALTLAALEEGLTSRRAVLILSPQWFRKTGVVNQAFASRFSQRIYQAMLKNPSLREETRQYLISRTKKLLAGDAAAREGILLEEKVLLTRNAGPIDRLREFFQAAFLKEKDRVSISLWQTLDQLRHKNGLGQVSSGLSSLQSAQEEGKIPLQQGGEPDWEALSSMARQEGEQEDPNPFFISPQAYAKLEPYLSQKKGMNADAYKGYQTGPEFDDLACFLEVCKDTGITPLLVLLPVNGYYYDYTQFPVSAREAYYEKIRTLAAKAGAPLADFSGEEYTEYFFEDRVHLGRKGWVTVNEAIYRFWKEGEEGV